MEGSAALTAKAARPFAGRRLCWPALVAALAAFPLLSPPPYWLSVLTEVLIYGAFAMSLDLLLGYTGLPSLGHAAFFGIGGYGAGLFALHRGADLLPGLAVALAAAGLAALAIGFLCIRAAGIYFLMLTLAAAQMVYAAAHEWTALTGGSNGLAGIPRPSLGLPGVALGDARHFYYLVALSFLLSLALLRRLIGSPFGRTLVGIRANEPRMRAMGYDTRAFKLAAFVVAGALAGLAGALYAYFNGFIAPTDLYWTASGQVMVMVIIGGAGTLVGPVLGSALLLVLQNVVSSYTERWPMVVGLLFVVAVLVARRGLVGVAGRVYQVFRAGLGTERCTLHVGTLQRSPPRDAPTACPEPAEGFNVPTFKRSNVRTPFVPTPLRVVALEKRFGGVWALNGVSLAVEQGERRAVIGPNGAGKTTLFDVISGETRASTGRVFVEGREITGLPPHQIAGRGIARTFQRNNVLFGLAVFENVRLAAQRQAGVARRLLTPVHQLKAVDAAAGEALDRVDLGARGGLLARDLSYGEQRQLELAMALALRPRLLLLDEPSAGMSPAETALLRDIIARVPRAITVVIIEHDMDVVFALADRITVMHQGQVLAEGTPEAVRGDRRVRDVYLGA